ncbi:glycoside hydrolase family 3 N-terminal domain-containing protein [Desulfoluna spongiiphila]|uniref:beta-N-acetylhexosaminidase n=1 Tax=Desulfoluna spongiiphila TaxID=419481 RepID=A0A1G5EHW0_9BACT|nr:glycoside hydrolase family 3 N-terminal domain-containing protein [Desulfoluna spongiiphila]SCY26589.1 beta-N-acetylhexosaminidase [Desulfoluna spongiiphila]
MPELSDMTLDEQVGQRLLVGFDGTNLTDDLKYLIGTLKVGGVILFAPNIESPAQVASLCADMQAYAADCGLPPLFISVDQEGGPVARMKEPLTLFPEGTPALKTREAARHFGSTTGKELFEVGYNMDMAPVLDVQPEGFSGIMEKRVFPGSPQEVGDLGVEVMETLEAEGVLAVVKHFPGIGRTTLDSHLTLPVLDTPFTELARTDLVPFEIAFGAGASAVMLSHIKYTDIDAQWPASLSPEVVKGVLRGRMGFNGVVMTDDLDMKAITCDMDTAARQIFTSDVDIALICHRSDRYETLAETLKAMATRFPGANALALGRILALKKKMAALAAT